MGLKINVDKTKEMRVKTPANTDVIKRGEQSIERVDQLRYLGSIVSKSGGTEDEVMARKRNAQHMYPTLNKVWRSRAISLKTNVRIFNSSVKTVLLYGCEMWKNKQGCFGQSTTVHPQEAETSMWHLVAKDQCPMRRCGQEPNRNRKWKQPSKEENGNGLDTHWVRLRGPFIPLLIQN